MAAPDRAVLVPQRRAEVASLATLWPKSFPGLTLEVAEPMHVLSLRHWPGAGTSALAAAMAAHALPALPQPGCCCGDEPRLIWRSPNETLLLIQDASRVERLRAALQPAPGAMACALDLSSGTLVVKLEGSVVDALLARLVDAQALPRDAGHASRIRFADMAAVVWREEPNRVGLLVDRAHDRYLIRWLSYAAEAI